jgi:CheY-like chemotaxis protein
MLELEGYEVTEAADGNQAIELHYAKAFDLIIIDIIMPGKL